MIEGYQPNEGNMLKEMKLTLVAVHVAVGGDGAVKPH
jgi:hypothetical protein